MQSDGNLVEYIPGGRVVWASNTAGNLGAVFIAQGDGNYAIRRSGNRPIWATGTKSGGTTLKIQDDRNLVVYAPVNKAMVLVQQRRGSAVERRHQPATSSMGGDRGQGKGVPAVPPSLILRPEVPSKRAL